MNKLKQVLFALAFVSVGSSLALADEIKAGDLVITQAWSRATPKGAKIGGAYLTIENKGSTADRLVGGSADAAGKVEIHEMTMTNGVMKMRPLEKGLEIDPGKTVKLSPGGYHMMLMDLKTPLKRRSSGVTSCRSRSSSKKPARSQSRSTSRASAPKVRAVRPAKRWT